MTDFHTMAAAAITQGNAILDAGRYAKIPPAPTREIIPAPFGARLAICKINRDPDMLPAVKAHLVITELVCWYDGSPTVALPNGQLVSHPSGDEAVADTHILHLPGGQRLDIERWLGHLGLTPFEASIPDDDGLQYVHEFVAYEHDDTAA